VSLYCTEGTAVLYRQLRAVTGGTRRRRRGGWIKGTSGVHDVAGGVAKTPRRDSLAATTGEVDFAWPLPAELLDASIAVDVRHYKGDVENTSDNVRARHLTLVAGDSSGEILGTAALRNVEPLAGGIVRLTFDYFAARNGIAPAAFRLARLSGPTSPADIVVTWLGERTVIIETGALDDSAPYSFSLTAENASVTRLLLDAIAVQADATGPPAPTSGSAEAV
jgi:hypothetical protein